MIFFLPTVQHYCFPGTKYHHVSQYVFFVLCKYLQVSWDLMI